MQCCRSWTRLQNANNLARCIRHAPTHHSLHNSAVRNIFSSVPFDKSSIFSAIQICSAPTSHRSTTCVSRVLFDSPDVTRERDVSRFVRLSRRNEWLAASIQVRSSISVRKPPAQVGFDGIVVAAFPRAVPSCSLLFLITKKNTPPSFPMLRTCTS